MDTQFKGFKWSEPTSFESREFSGCDFSGASFDGVYFVNCEFRQCHFEKGVPGNLAFFGCNFHGCSFKSFDFRRLSVGANGGTYASCQFVKCNFTGRQFAYPHFAECTFDQCKLKGVNFNDASFKKTKFIGKLEDTTFNGLYHQQSTGFKILDEVDFSDAVFGEFVTFEDCDLSTCIPPRGTKFSDLLYCIYQDNPKVLSTGSSDRIVLRGR